MQAADAHKHLLASSTRFFADVLASFLSNNWEMGDSNRQENVSSEGSSPPEETRDRQVYLSHSDMRSEEKRFRTFRHWAERSPVSPSDLSAAGFFFIGPGDHVQCFCCGGVLYDWIAEDDPMVEHENFFPTCLFIQGRDVGNQPLPQAGEIPDSVDGQFLSMLQSLNMEEAAVDSQPEYPDLAMERDRLRTYDSWPSDAQVSPEELAGAGFFYTGDRDYVLCFYCDGALRNWERGDDPWMEHARWFPRCEFLLQSRGRDFINSIQDSYFSTLEGNLYPPRPRPDPVSPQEPIQREIIPCSREVETEQPNQPDSTLSTEEKLRQLQEERMCKVCMDKDVSIVLVPCGHLVVCSECAPNLRRCPICRGAIRDNIKAFLS
ncbi:baculoviral IAP repeat-containing protein 7 isoform X2 [Anolis carolinensis]|uniref:baculoviral IAP repeat-containing protein 7 isoform X2 n=1 Tax=Anolis carolinensis TaxID=28377 RepID=UPI000462B5A4|nr:PREDICTED: baculoviral IAP repeat-containing protein 7 isoform X2 [Anolis carolinensis]|eukprot:XP_008108386.1 PREDICTED: baculoviral IAP repeat-containing protein 7 isoform X2 [Anolis carolinensis]